MKKNDKEKDLEDYAKKQKRMDLLNSKINLILPELMSRNIKLIERLKNKLKVSSFFNNIEHRNKKYFHDFIYSSDKRAKDLKTGLKMNKAIKQSSKTMSLLCRKISDDIILKNADILLKEKKLISQNTEQETHIKINELIQNLKNAVKTPYGIKIKPMKKIIKSLSQDEIKEAQDYIGDKILKEEKQIQDKINKYLKKMHKSLDKYANEENDEKKSDDFNNNDEDEDDSFRRKKIKRKKEFNKYVENIYIKDHIKFINYTKPKPFQIKDKESANLKRIKNSIFPPSLDLINNQNEKYNDNDSDNTSIQSKTFLINNKKKNKNIINSNNKLNRKTSTMINIKSNININKIMDQSNNNNFNNENIINELYNINVNGKDTLEVLNNLVNQGKYLSQRMNKKSEKINSLIEVNLPYPKSYELVINYFKNTQYLNDNNNKFYSYYPSANKNNSFNYINKNRTLPEITRNMRKKLSLIKDDIKNMKNSIIKNYLGYQTVNHENGFLNMNKNNEINKRLTHKPSMDNIFEKREHTVFITLKNMVNQQKNIGKRKVGSCNSIQNKI